MFFSYVLVDVFFVGFYLLSLYAMMQYRVLAFCSRVMAKQYYQF